MRARANLRVLSLAAIMLAAYSTVFFGNSTGLTASGKTSHAPSEQFRGSDNAGSALEPNWSDPSATEGGTAADPVADAAFVPIVPALMDYDYADKYLLQFIDNIPGYQLIEATISGVRQPVCVVTLTGTQAQVERIFLTNSP